MNRRKLVKKVLKGGPALIVIPSLFTTCVKEPSLTAPVLTTSEISSITRSTANCGGNVTNDGGATVISRGVCWSTINTPTISNNKTIDGAGAGSFSSQITGLLGGTVYFVRAYATNSIGSGYGMVMSFTTDPDTIPVLTTLDITAITVNTASSGGSISSDGGSSIIAKGVCWGKSSNPTILNDKTNEGIGSGSFISQIAGLLPSNTYYLRAYATNSIGTAYGNEKDFNTKDALIIDLTLPQFLVLNESGGSVITQGLIVANTSSGYVVLDSVCTHQGCTIGYSLMSNSFPCPCHGSVFSLTGSVMIGPATIALKTYPVTKIGNILTIEL